MMVEARSAVGLALVGLGLFVFIPLVLFLLLQQPLGPGLSLFLGLSLMAGHRFAAAPWAFRHSTDRCLWCGRAGVTGEALEVFSSGRQWSLTTCSPDHRREASRFLSHVQRYRSAIGLGIFVPLAALLIGTLGAAFGQCWVEHDTLALTFRTLVAATVLLVSLTYYATPIKEPLCFPFPLHNLCLLGIGKTLWVFRAVGGVWLLLSLGALGKTLGWL
jgi:hypothetical protein